MTVSPKLPFRQFNIDRPQNDGSIMSITKRYTPLSRYSAFHGVRFKCGHIGHTCSYRNLIPLGIRSFVIFAQKLSDTSLTPNVLQGVDLIYPLPKEITDYLSKLSNRSCKNFRRMKWTRCSVKNRWGASDKPTLQVKRVPVRVDTLCFYDSVKWGTISRLENRFPKF